jgi:hypothetical protein
MIGETQMVISFVKNFSASIHPSMGTTISRLEVAFCIDFITFIIRSTHEYRTLGFGSDVMRNVSHKHEQPDGILMTVICYFLKYFV